MPGHQPGRIPPGCQPTGTQDQVDVWPLDHTQTNRGDLYAALSAAGYGLRFTEYVTARMLTPDDTTTLHIPDATPKLATRRLITTPKGRPLAMEETHRSAEDSQLSYSLAPGRPISA